MATAITEQLDDEAHRHPAMIEWWTGTEGGKHMDENFIHRYFAESPFFDWTSKNGLIVDQSQRDIHSFNLTKNRKAFEDQLKRREGVEFIIVDTPRPVADKELAAQGVTTGVYVIRKQDRQRVSDDAYLRPPHVLVEKGPDGREAWEVSILGTYYIVGENILQAPSVFDILSNRLLTTTVSLENFYNVAGSLPRYNPAAGFHYLPRAQKAPTSLSAPGSPAQSREGSLAPGTEEQSLRSGSVQPESQAGGKSASTNPKDIRLLNQSLIDSIQFAEDYIDENPLLGEPGNFRFSASTHAIKKRRADEEAAAAKAKAEKESATTSQAGSPKVDKAPTPPAVFTEAKASTKDKSHKDERRAGKKAGDKQRRKSKAAGTATSPTTPASATSTAPNSAP